MSVSICAREYFYPTMCCEVVCIIHFFVFSAFSSFPLLISYALFPYVYGVPITDVFVSLTLDYANFQIVLLTSYNICEAFVIFKKKYMRNF